MRSKIDLSNNKNMGFYPPPLRGKQNQFLKIKLFLGEFCNREGGGSGKLYKLKRITQKVPYDIGLITKHNNSAVK